MYTQNLLVAARSTLLSRVLKTDQSEDPFEDEFLQSDVVCFIWQLVNRKSQLFLPTSLISATDEFLLQQLLCSGAVNVLVSQSASKTYRQRTSSCVRSSRTSFLNVDSKFWRMFIFVCFHLNASVPCSQDLVFHTI